MLQYVIFSFQFNHSFCVWQRVDSYYKRNYKDYFEFVEGGLQGKEEGKLSEAEKGILDWLKANK